MHINGKKLFQDGEEFLKIELNEFKKIISDYLYDRDRIIVPENIEYRYLYTHTVNGIEDKKIDYYEIKYLKYDKDEVTIEVNPPHNKDELKVKPYKGILILKNANLILNLSNRNDYISAIFNMELINRHTKFLVGVGIGIADNNEKIPMAKKVLLTKERIEDNRELYLILNESERITAIENRDEIRENRECLKSHLDKYINKIQYLNMLFRNLNKSNYFNSFYERLAFKEFSAVNNIFEKIKHNNVYFVTRRARVLETLIKSCREDKYDSLNMVMPIYTKDNIFEYQSKKDMKLQENFIGLAQSVSMNIIFIINDCEKPFSQEFSIFLEKISPLANLYISHKKNIENEVNSIDFLYTSKENFVVSKFLRVDNSNFYILQQRHSIEEHQGIYNKIFNRSVSYQEFRKNKNRNCLKYNEVLETISGEWYHYLYGSRTFWEDRVIIYKNGKVAYYSNNKKIEEGEIINKKFQSVVLFDDPITKRLFTMVFDHHPYLIQKAFFTKNIAKQFEKELDIFSVGILSRDRISIEKAKEILGDINEVTFLEENSIRERLSEYLRRKN